MEKMLFLFTFVASVLSSAISTSELLIQTDLGPVKGVLNNAGAREWSAIPYADPPVREKRWTQPVSPVPWNETFDSNFQPNGCAQACGLPVGTGTCPENVSEDCLYLSVFSPPQPNFENYPDGYPVYLFIHGGAFTDGIGNCGLYDGSRLAAEFETVVVLINYRLGAFGFMASESMEGNYGFMDQRLAMQWTHRNIAQFGGNPEMITISGQSAGAMSVGAHLVSPGSEGLYSKAIMESNPLGLPFHTRESAASNANDMSEYLGCPVDDVACMKSKSMDEIIDAQKHAPQLNIDLLFSNFLPWAPMVEAGGVIPVQPLYGLMNGAFVQKPIMSGSVRDEGQMFVYELFKNPVPKAAYNALMLAVFGKDNYREVVAMYPFDIVEGTTDGRDAANVAATDLLFYCPLRNVTKSYQAKLGDGIPSYIYRFEQVYSDTLKQCWEPDTTYCEDVVCHAAEMAFVFGNFNDGKDISYEISAEEEQLTKDLSAYWVNFMRTGKPSHPGGLETPADFFAYNNMADNVLFMTEPGPKTKKSFKDEQCDMWDRLGYFW